MYYNYDRVNYDELGITKEEFISLQIKYKNLLETYLKDIIDVNDINKYLDSMELSILDRPDKYPYHNDSNLGSKSIYLRNNMHIERLSKEEFDVLKNKLDIEFVKKTYEIVAYEKLEDANIFVGTPIPEREVKARSFIFEFAHDTRNEDMEAMRRAISAYEYLKAWIQKCSEKNLIPMSFYENDGLM